MERTVTYLEMTGHGDLRPGQVVPALALRRVEGTLMLVRSVHARIGEPYGWRGALRSDEEWLEKMLSRPLLQYWLITLEGETVGVADFEPQSGGGVEITTFGLLPEYVGKGLGGHALTLAIQQAWASEPLEAEAVRRVWLHTSTQDHPNALRNYQNRGLRVYRTEVQQ